MLTLDPSSPGRWEQVGRDGIRTPVAIDQEGARQYAKAAKADFEVEPDQSFTFDKESAKADVKDSQSRKASKRDKSKQTTEPTQQPGNGD